MARPRSLRLRTTWPPLVAPAGSATPWPRRLSGGGAPCRVPQHPQQRHATARAHVRHGTLRRCGCCGNWREAPRGGKEKQGGLAPVLIYFFFAICIRCLHTAN